MSPKEKSRQLVDKMSGFTLEDCKFSALVCADEMIDQQKEQAENMHWSCVVYWEEVKYEINKL